MKRLCELAIRPVPFIRRLAFMTAAICLAAAPLGIPESQAKSAPAANKSVQKLSKSQVDKMFYRDGLYMQNIGVIKATDLVKLHDISNQGMETGRIDNSQLLWAIDVLRGQNGHPYGPSDFDRYERQGHVLLLLRFVKHYTKRQQKIYAPVVSSFARSPSANVRLCVLLALWSLKEPNTAPIMSELLAEPDIKVSTFQRRHLSNFMLHCKGIDKSDL